MADVKTSNFIRNIIDEDLREGRHTAGIHTRFPPEPNGYLHIGQHFGSDEPVHTVAGPHESFMRVLPPAIVPLGLLREEALPALAPVQVGVYP